MNLIIYCLILIAASFFLKKYNSVFTLIFALSFPFFFHPLDSFRGLNEQVSSCEYKDVIEEINKSSFFIEKNISLDCNKFLIPSKTELNIFYKFVRFINIDYNFYGTEYESDLVFLLKALKASSQSKIYDTNNDFVISKEEFESKDEKYILESLLIGDCSPHNIDLNYCDEDEYIANFKKDSNPTFKIMLKDRRIPYYILN